MIVTKPQMKTEKQIKSERIIDSLLRILKILARILATASTTITEMKVNKSVLKKFLYNTHKITKATE